MSNVLEPQNFSILAGNKTTVVIDINPDDTIDLVGSTIVWKVYEQEMGLPIPDTDPVLIKTNGDGGTLTVTDPVTQKLSIPIEAVDCAGLLRNYYHECTVTTDETGPVTTAMGIMTVLGTENR